jgi:small subunit ribosomal protein S1
LCPRDSCIIFEASNEKKENNYYMANTTESASRALTMRDFFKEENGEIVPIDESVLIDFKDGDIVEGDVVRIDKDEVLVDIGYKSEGLIPSNELSIRKGADPQEIVELGQHIEALVLQKEDADGRLILSAKRAAFEKAWNRIEEAHADQRTVEGPIIEVVKGGLILDIGLRGFLPASLVDIRRVRNLDSFMGQRLECKVIELNRSRNNVVLSRRAVLEEERKEERHRILTTLQEGDIVEGTVSNLVDFGAFVDLEGIDGLIHISELSWNHVDHPSEVVEVGEDVRVKVLEVDRDRERISLGLKQTRKDPWQEIVERVSVGEQIHGRVTKLVSFGAFVEVAEGVEGLIHISELADHHVETPDEIVRSGDEVDARIIDVDAKRRRLSLSLRPKKEEREDRIEREDREEYSAPTERDDRGERTERPRREDRFRRDFEQRGSRDNKERDRDRERGGRDRDRGDRVGDGLRTGAFDKLKDLDLGDG